MIAATMTQTSRLTILDGQVGEDVGDRVALVDGVLEILEDRLLANELLRVDGAVLEERRDRLAVDGVGVLLDFAELARAADDVGVLVATKLRHDDVDAMGAVDEDLHELLHRLGRLLDAEHGARADRTVREV